MKKRLPGLILLGSLLAACAASCVSVPAPGSPTETGTPPPLTGWAISPPEGYADGYGYVRLEFTPPARLTVHLGRQRLDHANTAWYSFTVTEGSSTLLSVDGAEGIPNVKGPDGNWWSDVELDLPSPVISEARVSVEDSKIGVMYVFTLRKVERFGMAF
jgi:hypothetical protein